MGGGDGGGAAWTHLGGGDRWRRSDRTHEALQRFLALYGAEAGNLALKLLAIGGVYVGGGIAPKLADEFASSAFVERFMAKGRMRALMEDMPVYLVLDDRAGLWGAASHAAARRQANNG